jgi:hypothetical protein
VGYVAYFLECENTNCSRHGQRRQLNDKEEAIISGAMLEILHKGFKPVVTRNNLFILEPHDMEVIMAKNGKITIIQPEYPPPKMSDDVMRRYHKRNITIDILKDYDPQNPRDDDNLGKMICFHDQYILGDVDRRKLGTVEQELIAIYESLNKEAVMTEADFDGIDGIVDQIKNFAVILPLYLYDHGGITISTGPFSCPWDSGQVGFIYCSFEDGRKEFPDLSFDDFIKQITEILEGEVKNYDDYLVGNYYGYRVYENGEEIETLWGFSGDIDSIVNEIATYYTEILKEEYRIG